MESNEDQSFTFRVFENILTTEKELNTVNLNRISKAHDYLHQINHLRPINKTDVIQVNVYILGTNPRNSYRELECRPYGYNHQYLESSFVPYLMENWLIDFNENLLKSDDLLSQFLSIHPFLDGNGRTGKLLTFYYTQFSYIEFTSYYDKIQKKKLFPHKNWKDKQLFLKMATAKIMGVNDHLVRLSMYRDVEIDYDPYDRHINAVVKDDGKCTNPNCLYHLNITNAPSHFNEFMQHESKQLENCSGNDSIDGLSDTFDEVLIKIKEAVKSVKNYINEKVGDQKKNFTDLINQSELASRELHYMWECEMDKCDGKVPTTCIKIILVVIGNLKKMITDSFK